MSLTAAVIGGPDGPAPQVASGLRDAGADVVVLAPGGRSELAAQLIAAGRPRLVVWAPTPGPAATPTPLTDYDEKGWDTVAAQPIRDAIACLQAAADAFDGSGASGASGAIVALLPTLSSRGSAGLTGWSTAAEGVRSLVKVAAREYGPRQITVNAVALPGAALAGAEGSLDRPGLPAATLPAPADAGGDVSAIIAALASPPWTSVTGATIAVDGGVWMPA
jgi:NAD(P)-dependent dehydrogenase (short-subunit alcohol dehydrogenase family)